MSAPIWSSPRLRRGIALSAVVLATGGLVLHKSAAYPLPRTVLPRGTTTLADGKNSAAFAGPGAHGMVALSHTRVLSGQETRIFAEVRLVADENHRKGDELRAPTSIAVVLDTSGSMSGTKIEDAKRSVLRLLSEMRDDDEIAVVRFSNTHEVLQPLARVGNIRGLLTARIARLDAGGGTNIPGGLSAGLAALSEAAKTRVRRIVLASDGLDGTRSQAETLARSSFASGITVSSLGIGLDFDEGYMGSLAQLGHGNFAFVNDASSLSTFLTRELDETASTTVADARIRLSLPEGVTFVAAHGADALASEGGVELTLGSLFAGDERRAIVELRSAPFARDGNVVAHASWREVGGAPAAVDVTPLVLAVTTDAAEVERGRDGAVLASATSVLASRRQLEAAGAYARGDITRAVQLADENEKDLAAIAAEAPKPAADALTSQISSYREMKQGFLSAAPSSAAGKAHAKSAAAQETRNLDRKAW